MKSILIVILVVMFFGCRRFEIGTHDPGYMAIYKTNQDYSEFVCVSLTSVNNEDLGHPLVSYVNDKKPVDLVNGYKVNNIELDLVYTDIKIEDWPALKDSLETNHINDQPYIYNRIIDFNPFEEFYIDYEHRIDYFSVDTAYLNDLILRDELNKYFEREK